MRRRNNKKAITTQPTEVVQPYGPPPQPALGAQPIQPPQPYYQTQPQIHYIQSPGPTVPVQQTVIVQGQKRGCLGRSLQ